MSKYVINENHPPAIYDLHAVSVSGGIVCLLFFQAIKSFIGSRLVACSVIY